MSKAYRCDRCGTLFCLEVMNRNYYITTSRMVSGICADLCEECQKQLDMFYKNKNAIVSIPSEVNYED